jgi:sarcosine oxidase
MKRADVAIVGGGVMGCATAWALARAGREVVLFERYEIGHTKGSSHGSARIFRESYTDPQYVRMMREAIPLWRDLEEELGEQLLAVTGAVNIGERLGYLIASMTAAGSPFEIWHGSELDDRFPGVSGRGHDVVFDPTAGVVFAERAWRAFAEAARRHGATIHENAPATFDASDDEVRVNDVVAKAVVVTAGPWVGDLVPGIAVRTTRETIGFYDVERMNGIPVLIDWSRPLVYGVPTPEGTFKTGRHIAGVEAHPESSGTPDADSLRFIDEWMVHHLPGREMVRTRAETCMYTNTADESFIMRRDGRVIVGSPCSGHGFKFAPLIGERLAALAMEL